MNRWILLGLLPCLLQGGDADTRIRIQRLYISSWHSSPQVMAAVQRKLVDIKKAIISEGYDPIDEVKITSGGEKLTAYKKGVEFWYQKKRASNLKPDAISIQIDSKEIHILYVYASVSDEARIDGKKERLEDLERTKAPIAKVIDKLVTE